MTKTKGSKTFFIAVSSVLLGALGAFSAVMGLIRLGSAQLTATALGLATWMFTVGNIILLAGSLAVAVAGIGLLSLHPRARMLCYAGYGLMAGSTLFVWIAPSFRLFGAGNLLPVIIGAGMVYWIHHSSQAKDKAAPPAEKPSPPQAT